MNGSMYHFLPNSSIQFSHEENLFYADPHFLPSDVQIFQAPKSHSISVHPYLRLSKAVGKHFKQSVPEGDKNWQGGRGRQGTQVSACQNNEKYNVEACGPGGGGGVIFTEPNEMTPE